MLGMLIMSSVTIVLGSLIGTSTINKKTIASILRGFAS